jgi:hypothetical protein
MLTVAARLRVSTVSELPGTSDLFATPLFVGFWVGTTGTLGLVFVRDILDVQVQYVEGS